MNKTVNTVLRNAVKRLYKGVLYFTNVHMFLACAGKCNLNSIPYLFTCPLNAVVEFVTKAEEIQDDNINQTGQEQSQDAKKKNCNYLN
jgi:hypothetical protein